MKAFQVYSLGIGTFWSTIPPASPDVGLIVDEKELTKAEFDKLVTADVKRLDVKKLAFIRQYRIGVVRVLKADPMTDDQELKAYLQSLKDLGVEHND